MFFKRVIIASFFYTIDFVLASDCISGWTDAGSTCTPPSELANSFYCDATGFEITIKPRLGLNLSFMGLLGAIRCHFRGHLRS